MNELTKTRIIWGAISAVLGGSLTVIGIILGVYLEQLQIRDYESFVHQRELARLICKNVQARYLRAKNVFSTRGSDVFEKRWDDYIVNGYTPWNENYYMMLYGVNAFYGGELQNFIEVGKKFQLLHDSLVDLRRKVHDMKNGRNRKKAETEIKDIEPTIKTKLKDLGFRANSVVDRIARSAYKKQITLDLPLMSFDDQVR